MNITLALDLSSPSGLVTESAILSRGDNVHWDIAVPLPTPLRGVLRRMPLDTKGFKGMDRWTLVIPREGADLSSLIGIRYLRINGFPLHARTTAALANGYQCWSESPIVNRDTILYGERFPTRRPYGDADFYDYPELPGMFHSWSFSYSMIDGSTSNPFFAGLREDLFHTAFEFDLNAATVGIAMDVEGCSWNAGTFARLQLDGEQCLILGEWIVPNPIAQDFLPLSVATARWMELVRECEHVTRALVSKENRSTRMAPVRGYTSWYYYYNRISLSLLERMIDTIADKTDATIFQMDDGYQHRVGDWLIPSPRFARGVKRVATKASSRGLVPGIWCAPFIVMENAKLYAEHPEWVLRDGAGRPVVCGDHPLWGGRFYALDSEHPEVRRYLEEVFRTFIVDWGFRFIKADFLYATARVPAGGMTRAERAARAHQFLYDLCLRYGAQLLSCGATLPSAYGRTDYARIGADVSETWENATEGRTPSREKVSTRASLTNTVTRAPLNGVMFGNDPDVIIIRSDRQLLWRRERWTLAEVNSCLGSLVFSSDHPSWYGRWQRQVVRQLKHRFGNGPWRVSSVESLRIDDTGIAARIRFSGRSEKLSVNLSDHKAGALLPHKSVIHE